MKKLAVLIVILSQHVLANDEDLFSSTFQMERLLEKEEEFSAQLFDYVAVMEKTLAQTKDFLTKVYKDGPLRVQDRQAYVQNPLNALGITRRLGFETAQYQLLSHFHQVHTLQESLINIVSIFPTVQNYADAVSSIGLLQETYNLDPAAMAMGIVKTGNKTYTSNHVPSWDELWELGRATSLRFWLDIGLTWFDEAKKRCPPELVQTKCRELEAEIADAKQVHDHFLDTRGQVGPHHRCFALPFSEKLRKKKKYRKAKQGQVTISGQDLLIPLFTENATHVSLKDNFHKICKTGPERWRTPDVDANLRCRFHHLSNPYLRLGPFKLEEKSDEPFVVVFHDFFSQDNMDALLDEAKDKLVRSQTGTRGSSKATLTRTSKQTWLHDTFYSFDIYPNETMTYDEHGMDPPPIPYNPGRFLQILHYHAFKVSLRIQNATRLRVIGPLDSEPYQIANYGMGGQYSTHLDSTGFFSNVIKDREQLKQSKAVGDRIVTFMGYLSNVEHGGSTVFAATGISVEPEKGSAIFWVNLKSDGTQDKLTFHGGCPVLYGSKWITNKWINHNEQLHVMPCGLQRNQRHDLFHSWRSM